CSLWLMPLTRDRSGFRWAGAAGGPSTSSRVSGGWNFQYTANPPAATAAARMTKRSVRMVRDRPWSYEESVVSCRQAPFGPPDGCRAATDNGQLTTPHPSTSSLL